MTFDIELLDALDQATKDKIDEWHNAETLSVTRVKDTVVQEHKELKDKVATYGGFDSIDTMKKKADTADAAESAATKASNEKAVAEGDLSSITAQFKTELAQKEVQIQEIRTGLMNKEKQSSISAAITVAKGSPELLLPHIEGRVRVKMENGNTVLEVLKVDGTLWVTDKGLPATVNDLVAEFKSNDVYGACFDAPKASGSGSVTNGVASTTNELKTLEDVMAAAKDGTITAADAGIRAKAFAIENSKPSAVAAVH